MNKIDFKDYPDLTTPVEADNLNLMQDNIEDAIDDANTNIGDLTELETTVKTDLVSAINEANQHGTGGGERLPVGSELDYTGNVSDIPTGWEQITDPNSYSSNEVKTDKTWINGKPIYRKVISGTLPTISGSGVVNTNIAHNISNFDVCTNISGYFTQLASPDYKPMLPILSNSGKVTAVAQVSSTNVVIRSNNESWAANAWDYTIIIEYTKTTD